MSDKREKMIQELADWYGWDATVVSRLREIKAIAWAYKIMLIDKEESENSHYEAHTIVFTDDYRRAINKLIGGCSR